MDKTKKPKARSKLENKTAEEQWLRKQFKALKKKRKWMNSSSNSSATDTTTSDSTPANMSRLKRRWRREQQRRQHQDRDKEQLGATQPATQQLPYGATAYGGMFYKGWISPGAGWTWGGGRWWPPPRRTSNRGKGTEEPWSWEAPGAASGVHDDNEG